MKLTMTLSKSTKNTHVYTNEELKAAIPSMYIKKDSMSNPPPQTISVSFIAVED